MTICTRSLASVQPHMRGKAFAVIREHFRRNRQDFRRGFAWTFRRNKPRIALLPIVAPEPEPFVYMSTYLSPNVAMRGPVATCTLDKI